MIKLILSLGLLLALVFGLAELADMPGHILIDAAGMEIRLNLLTGLAALVGIIFVTMVIWWLVRVFFRLPGFLRLSSRLRRRANGQAAISRGFIALGTGDERAARRYAEEAMRLLGQEPLPLLLKAQAAQLAGDGKGAQSAFRTMLETQETASLGLRGLFIEAERQGDAATARQMAEEALCKEPATPWANAALLGFYAQARDWAGAIRILDQSISRRLVDRETGRAQRAILLAAAAQEQRESNPDEAKTLALEALRFAPGLVPAAVIAAQRFSAQGGYAKATKILETAWKLNPHPDLAEAYTHVRLGDAAMDRLARAKTLQKLSGHARESRFVVARAALDAQDFALARRELDTLLLEKPTTRACLLMAELEERESGDAARARSWLARAARAKRDPVWMADGVVSAEWAATSPVTGRIGAFEWRDPPEIGTGMLQNLLEEGREVVEPSVGLRAAPPPMLIEQSPIVEAAEPASAAPLSPAAEPPPQTTLPAIIPDDPGSEEGNLPKKRRFGLF